MRFFALLNLQQVAAIIVITLIFLILFGVALSVLPMSGPRDRALSIKTAQRFSDGIEKGDGPFPLIISLLIGGTIVWALFYILFYRFSEVKL